MFKRWERGATIRALSSPRTHTGMVTGSLRTLAKPQSRMRVAHQSMQSSSWGVPLSRWPNRSHNVRSVA